MADTKIFAGPRIRRLRQERSLTQSAMAQQLSISPSYLNLLERNQRPLSAQLVLKLVATFDLDVAQLMPERDGGTIQALKEVFSDPLLARELPGDAELIDVADAAPNLSGGVVKLYRAYREQQQRLSDLSQAIGEGGTDNGQAANRLPFDQVRTVFETAPWSFPALEAAATDILSRIDRAADIHTALQAYLRSAHGLTAQVLPADTMPYWRKRVDRHSNRLFLSERLPRHDLTELIAQEIALQECSALLTEEAELSGVEGAEALRLAKMELARYLAHALIMPYDRFARATDQVLHDPVILAQRFATGLGQAVHRMVSLQDRSSGKSAGLPFFAMEVDQGGNVLKRFGAKGFPVSRFGGNCPKLNVHLTFSQPAQALCERVVTVSGDVFITMSHTLPGPAETVGERPRRTAILWAIHDPAATASFAKGRQQSDGEQNDAPAVSQVEARLSHARGLPPMDQLPPTPIGTTCRLCERLDCTARASPPVTRPLGLDDLVQGFGAYGLV